MPFFTKSLPVVLLVGASALASPIAPQTMDGNDLCIKPCILPNGDQLCSVPYNNINFDDPATYEDYRPSQIPSTDFLAYLKTCHNALNDVDGKKACSPDNGCVMLARPYGSASSNSSSNFTSSSNSSSTSDVQGTVLLTATNSRNNTAPNPDVTENSRFGVQAKGPVATLAAGDNENGLVDFAQTNGLARISESGSESASNTVSSSSTHFHNSPSPSGSIPTVTPSVISSAASSIVTHLANAFGVASNAGNLNSGNLFGTLNRFADTSSNANPGSVASSGLSVFESADGSSANSPSNRLGVSNSADGQSGSAEPIALTNGLDRLQATDSVERPSAPPSVGVVPLNGEVPLTTSGQTVSGPSGSVRVPGSVNRNSTRPSGRVGIIESAQPSTPAGSSSVDVSGSANRQTETGSSNGLEVSESANPSASTGSSNGLGISGSANPSASTGSSNGLEVSGSANPSASTGSSNGLGISGSANPSASTGSSGLLGVSGSAQQQSGFPSNRVNVSESADRQADSSASNSLEVSSTGSNANQTGVHNFGASVEGDSSCKQGAREGAAVGM
ncbi:hypothetical protein F5050DRAFT_646906 [Lentinula boryana]|uniref:Uncharacterized protein n=1 Tax=Lentinula boryana TaxID=40481 RepID=A0ABQ8Q5G9_9AGAR|nr:hypothetical protein F5050DRAFT_646906 [Lentinula boryana]